MFAHAVTILLSAFLLFLVQPLIAKQILPWFGGSASVWTTCLLFFQTMLLCGYAYADAVVRWLKPRQQVLMHGTLLMLSWLALPIAADPSWKPVGDEPPILRILGLLSATIGLPYLLLSTTSPLVQVWYSRRFDAQVPYRLYALSNLASLVALLGYPILIEPYFGVAMTQRVWSWLYAAFTLTCLFTGLYSLRATPAPVAPEKPSAPPAPALRPAQIVRWLVLSGTGSCLLLAVSNHLTQNVASVPFLWVLPLALYLLTLIISFDHPRWYARRVFLLLTAACVITMAGALESLDLRYVAPSYALGLFVCCMFCHGELASLKPDPRQLTAYFLVIAAGSAFGAMLIAIGAPLALPGNFEMHAVLTLVALLVVAHVWSTPPLFRWASVGLLCEVVLLCGQAIAANVEGTHSMQRSFYGALRTRDFAEPAPFRTFIHGGINHGGQRLTPAREMDPVSYYGRGSAYGRLLSALQRPRKIGVVGLGAGALMSYAREGDSWVFYELDPTVVSVSAREFSYARRTKAHVEFVVGDGRLALEREPQRGYDVLALDAFSSDSIPMHLVTREAMAAYVKHLAPGGALVFQATNRFVDLLPVIRRLADEHGMQTLWIRDDSDDGDAFTFASDQVIVTADPQLLELQALKSVGAPAPSRPDLPTFTDDYHNLLRILHQRGKRPPQSQRTQPSSGSTERSASPAASVASQARGS